MVGYCRNRGGKIEGGWRQNYDYVIETNITATVCNAIPALKITMPTSPPSGCRKRSQNNSRRTCKAASPSGQKSVIFDL
jgi:hypothetical protein